MARGATQQLTQNQSQVLTTCSAAKTTWVQVCQQQESAGSRDDLGDFSKDSLQEALGNANMLHEKVNRPREQAKDSEVFVTLAASGVEQAKKLAAGAKSRTAKDVIRRLKLRFAPEAQEDVENDPSLYDWMAAGNHCLHLFSNTPGVGCMLGAMAAKPKVRKVHQRQQKTKLGALEKPQEVKRIDTEQKQETDRLMEEMWLVLEAQQTVGWLELVMNHRSFSQTVENIFTLSFLIRDSRASFTPDEAQGVLVHAHNPKKASGSDDAKERVQSMQSYGMEDWDSWKDYVAPSACLTPHRDQEMYEGLANGQTLTQHNPASGEGERSAKRKGNGSHRRPAADDADDDEEEPQDLSEEDDSNQDTGREKNGSKRTKRHR